MDRQKKKIISIILVLIAIVVTLFGCTTALAIDRDEKENVESDFEPEKVVIDIPEPSVKGCITVKNSDGAIVYQYEGEIDVVNDGSNGEDIDIRVNLPDEGICDNCLKNLPNDVVLYDRSNKKVITYYAYPEINNDTLNIYEASELHREDVSHLLE